MSRIDYIDDAVQVDAHILARAFRISEESLKHGMRDGAITSRFEKGEGEDAGRVRLTFFSADRRVRMIADDRGSILTCSAADLRRKAPGASVTPGGTTPEADGGGTDGDRADDAVRRAHLDALLDEALRETFPASDPVSIG